MAEVVGADVGFEAIGGPGQQWHAHHASVVHKHVNGFHRIGECPHAGQVAEVQMTNLDVAGHVGQDPLALLDVAARDQHAVSLCGERRRRRLAHAAVAARDDDPHDC